MNSAHHNSHFDGLAYAKTLPASPGVYRMFDDHDVLLYVGKAKSLTKRVASYFQKHHDDKRIAALVSQIRRMEVTVVPTEVDALVLESRLIKSDKPKYNIALRDDRGYPYLHLSTDAATPRLRIHYGPKGSTGKYFGPFPSSDSLHQALDAVLRHFKLRTCSDAFFANRSRPCLEYQIKRCSAPCVNYISPNDYREDVKAAQQVLDGKSDELAKTLMQQMQDASEQLQFEQAARLRDQIQAITRIQSKLAVNASSGDHDVLALSKGYGLMCLAVCHVRQGNLVGSKTMRLDGIDYDSEQVWSQFMTQYIQDPARPLPPQLVLDVDPKEQADLLTLLNEAAQKLSISTQFTAARATHQSVLTIARETGSSCIATWRASTHLQTQRLADLVRLLDLPLTPERIECYDISHLQGQDTIASCVVAGTKGPIKSGYRRYNITGITPGDDYAAMEQVLRRRFAKPKDLPDLLLIDGGAGQVTKALQVLGEFNVEIPVIGVSKGPERKAGAEVLIVGQTGQLLEPGPASPALHLIQSIRDEAHRFAIEGHRKKRSKRMIKSTLLDIPGVGASKRQALLAVFGSITDIKNASVEELAKVPGIGSVLAAQIKSYFSGS